MTRTFDDCYDRLLASLMDLAVLLRACGEAHWAGWMERGRARVAGGDYYGLSDLLQAFGGIGSFNDLIIHPANGHQVAEADVDWVNERLSKLRSLVWTDATEMRKELDAS